MIAACAYRAVVANGVAGTPLAEYRAPAPEHNLPISEPRDLLERQIVRVIGNYLRLRRQIAGARPADPNLTGSAARLRRGVDYRAQQTVVACGEMRPW